MIKAIKIIFKKKLFVIISLSILGVSAFSVGIYFIIDANKSSKTPPLIQNNTWIRIRCTEKTRVNSQTTSNGTFVFGWKSFIVQKSADGINWKTDNDYNDLLWNDSAMTHILPKDAEKNEFNRTISLSSVSSEFNKTQLDNNNIIVYNTAPYNYDKSGDNTRNHGGPYDSTLIGQYFDSTVPNAGGHNPFNDWPTIGFGESIINTSIQNPDQNYVFKKNDVNKNYDVNLSIKTFQFLNNSTSNFNSSMHVAITNNSKLDLTLADNYLLNKDKTNNIWLQTANNGFVANTQLVLHVIPKIKLIKEEYKNNFFQIQTDFNWYKYINFFVDNSWINSLKNTKNSYINKMMLILFVNSNFISNQEKLYPDIKIGSSQITFVLFKEEKNSYKFYMNFPSDSDEKNWSWLCFDFKSNTPNSINIGFGTNDDELFPDNIAWHNYFLNSQNNSVFSFTNMKFNF